MLSGPTGSLVRDSGLVSQNTIASQTDAFVMLATRLFGMPAYSFTDTVMLDVIAQAISELHR